MLQKAVIEEFLPRYGYGSDVLYVGDSSDRFLLHEKDRLQALGFFELAHGELPDIVAYSTKRRWLYLIEAVHSSGPVSPIRHLELDRLTTQCQVGIVYVTAFLNRKTFRKFAADISWETEVWIADAPDHLVHFNGDSFMGPHKSKRCRLKSS
jgi:type II restriction enzyme